MRIKIKGLDERKAFGGTELMRERINREVDPELMQHFNIIHSRVTDDNIDPNKHNILVLNDTWDDPMNRHLADPASRARFAKLVFVSNYQLSTFNTGLGVPYAETVVLQNAIDPILWTPEDKMGDKIRLIYHTTPHRGLELLVPAFEAVASAFPDIHLDVFSSFKAYGWDERDAPYQELFQRIKANDKMTYHGFQPNAVVRDYLARAHIFAYPNIWPETSCIAAIEAGAAGVQIVTSNLAALPETCGMWASIYGYHEDPTEHANLFANMLYGAIQEVQTEDCRQKLEVQSAYFNHYYNMQLRGKQWSFLLESILASK
jgi:glycosyltransferase involved in cell wall biosynthesis